jgi:hypothetical protein
MRAAVFDMGLPDRHGDMLGRELRALYPGLPVVVGSGRSRHRTEGAFRRRAAAGGHRQAVFVE